MYSFKLNPYPDCAAICNRCKWFVPATDKTDIITNISAEKFGLGKCTRRHCFSVGHRLQKLYETCDRFEYTIHENFGLKTEELDDYSEYIKFFNNWKIIFIREIRENKEVEETMKLITG